MEELFEACSVMRQGHLSEPAVKRIASSLQRRVGGHPGFTREEKAFLREQVQQVPRADGVAHYAIRELSERVSRDYLARWAAAVQRRDFRAEHFARHVGAHLLDSGFSGQYLRALITAMQESPEAVTLAEFCEQLQGEVRTAVPRQFEVMLAFRTAPWVRRGLPDVWLTGAAITGWLSANGFDTTGVRAAAAMIISVRARDEIGAAEAARNEAERYSARALLGTGQPLAYLPNLWVRGSAAAAPMTAGARGVAVSELFREDRVFSTDVSQDVDAALELLAHLEGSSPPAAVAGGWGAIEGLLADPNDRSSAADNLADTGHLLVPACRTYRTLASRRAHHAGRVCRAFGCECQSRALPNSGCHDSRGSYPRAAERRGSGRRRTNPKLLADPRLELHTIKDMIGDSFHRLYRQRNLILHGGRLDSVALTASLRTVAKLAGAGMDRITHGHYVQRLRPLELVAKANMALALVGRDDPLGCVDLLEVD